MNVMKTSILAAALSGLAAATMSSWDTASPSGYYYSQPSGYADCPLYLADNQFVQFSTNQATVSQVNKDMSFLQPQDLHIITPYDLSNALEFVTPDFALGGNCSFVLAVPSEKQINGDLNQAIVGSVGGFTINAALLNFDLSNTDSTYNNLGGVVDYSQLTSQLIPGTALVLNEITCPPPGTTIPILVSSPDTFLTVRDDFGQQCLSGLFLVVTAEESEVVTYTGSGDYSSTYYTSASAYASASYTSTYSSHTGWSS